MAGEDRYRLAPVRDARARDERIRRGDLAVAVGDASETAARLDAARGRTAAARKQLAAAIAARDALAATTTTRADHLARAELFIARRRAALDRVLGEELRAEAAHDTRLGSLDDARRRLVRARAEREVIERHFTAWRQARKKLAERRED